MLKGTNAEFSFIEVWFTDQNNRPLEIEVNCEYYTHNCNKLKIYLT